MKSIQTKIVVLIMMVVMLCSFVVGGIGIWHIKTISDQNSSQIMNLRCREEGKKIERIFYGIEQSVKIVAQNTVKQKKLEKILGDRLLRVRYIEELRPVLLAAAKSTDGAVSAYIQFNPEIAPSDSGLLYSKTVFSNAFVTQNVVDLAKEPKQENSYDWYYKAVEAQEPVWLDPYDNGRVLGDVISYVIPIYQGELLIGVAGMDVLFSDITKEIANVMVYESGVAGLLNSKDEILYYPLKEPQDFKQDLTKWEKFVQNTANDQDGRYAFEYDRDGQKQRLTYYEMQNHMRLILMAPTSEIDEENDAMIRVVTASVVIISCICIIVSYLVGQSIVRPLKELTEASQKIAEGNLKIQLPSGLRDEVGILADSLQQMVERLSGYMERISELAYRDPLTGVKSKSAYKEEIEQINKKISSHPEKFGLVIFDVNNLKQVNDNYGHEEGDLYIKSACKLICTVYKRSPVFRIGGDEFAAILTGHDLLNAEELLRLFYEKMSDVNRDAVNPYEKVSVAAGVAIFKEKRDKDFHSVFKRADENMYKNKKSIKSGNGPILTIERV